MKKKCFSFENKKLWKLFIIKNCTTRKIVEINRKSLCKRRQYTVYSEHNIYYYKTYVGKQKKKSYLFTLVPQKH